MKKYEVFFYNSVIILCDETFSHWSSAGLHQDFGEPLFCVGDSNESSAHEHRPREAPGLAVHAGTRFTADGASFAFG